MNYAHVKIIYSFLFILMVSNLSAQVNPSRYKKYINSSNKLEVLTNSVIQREAQNSLFCETKGCDSVGNNECMTFMLINNNKDNSFSYHNIDDEINLTSSFENCEMDKMGVHCSDKDLGNIDISFGSASYKIAKCSIFENVFNRCVGKKVFIHLEGRHNNISKKLHCIAGLSIQVD